MRYEGCLLTEAESQALIDEVDRWCRRTGTNYNKLVVVARVGVTTRHKVRLKGQRLTKEVANRLSQAMAAYRFGISRDEYRQMPKPWRGARIVARLPVVEPVRVNSETCGRCGARAGRCDHTANFEPVWSPRMVGA